MIIPDPYNKGQYINTDRPRAKDDYTSYSDRRRHKKVAVGLGAVIGAGGAYAAYLHKETIGSSILKGLSRLTKKAIGQSGASLSNSSRISETYSIQNRMVREISRTIRAVKAKEYTSAAAQAVLQTEELTKTFGVKSLRKAFGLGKEIDGKVIPDGNQFSYWKALSSTFFRPDDPRSRYDILYDRFTKLSKHSNVQEMLEERIQYHINHKQNSLLAAEAKLKAQHEFAHGMATAHLPLTTDTAAAEFRNISDAHAQVIVDHFTDKVVNPILANEKNTLTHKLFNFIGVKGRTVGSDPGRSIDLKSALSSLGSTPVINPDTGLSSGGIDTSKLFEALSNLTDHNIVSGPNLGEEINLTMGKVAISKTYNKLREQLQIPVAPFQGGFNLFSFFPHLRGQSNQFIHVVDSRNPLPFLDNILKKSESDNTSSLGTFIVMGNKQGLSGYRGKGFFIGEGFDTPADFVAQDKTNSAISDILLDVRDAKSGWLKEVNDRANKSFISQFYPQASQSPIGKFFFPGGKEESDTLFNRYLGVFKKFKDPTYLPNVYRDKILKGTPDPESLDHLSKALKNNSGDMDVSRVLDTFNKNGSLKQLTNNNFLHPSLVKLLEHPEGLSSDNAVLEYFTAQAQDFEDIIKDPNTAYRNPGLKNLVAGFRSSVETAFGYGRNNDPYNITDELGLNYLKGTLGESSKSQGLDYIREQVFAELNLQTNGGVRKLLDASNIPKKAKHQSFLLGHELSEFLEQGFPDRAIELLRPSARAGSEELSIATGNRGVVEHFIKTRYPLTGTNWKTEAQARIDAIKASGGTPEAIQEALEGMPSEGTEYARGRYLINKASTAPSNPLDYLFDFKNTANRVKDSVLNEYDTSKSLFSHIKDWFTGSTPEAKRASVEAIQQDAQDSALGRRLDYWNHGVDSGSNFRLSLFDPYFLTTRLNKFMSPLGLSLGAEDMKSPGSILSAITFKRVLPGLGALRGLDYLDYKADERDDDNSPDNLLANVRANTDLINARLSDKTGFTNFKKKIADLLPGSEQYLNFSPKSAEEYQEYLTSGRDTVRKSRGWLFGSRTPYAGTSIAYYEPNFYQRSISDYESAPGGRKSKETFLLETGSLNSVENKNSTGLFSARPYVYSSPLVDPNVIGGNLINATLGALIKPQRQLNDPSPYLAYHSNGISELGNQESGISVDGNNSSPGISSGSESTVSGDGLNSSSGLNIFSTPGVVPGPRVRQLGANVLRVTGNGNFTPKNTSENDLEEYTDKSPNDIYSENEYLDLNSDVNADWKALQNVRASRNMYIGGQGLEPSNPQSIANQYSQLTHHIKNVSGIYGFFSSLFTPDKETKAVYADASRAYGWESRFYDADRGATFMGLPGSLVGDQGANEVIRRFITRKESNKKIFNPIPNEFAGSDFLPGADEYTNLQSGDPKSIKGGMFRLPGEAYRRIHPVRLLTVNAEDAVGSSEDLVSSLIRPGFFSPDSVGHVFAKIKPIVGDDIETSVSYDNKDYNLKAFADAVLNNQNGSKTPILVRNLSGDEFSSVSSSGPREEEKDYLSILNKLSGTSNGMAIYINPETGEKSVQNTQFEESRFRQTMDKVDIAREDVLQLIKSRVISEADIYDPVTKFDIASDVAPYSAKTRALASVISASDGVPEEDWKKFQAIKKRTSKQKKQTEVFQYRFKNIDDRVMQIGGKVETVGDDGSIYFEGEDTPVKLAGGRISIGKVREYLAERNLTTPEDQSEMGFFLGLFGVRPGRAFSMTVDKDAPYERRKDLLHTRRAIIGNVNKKLIQEGIIEPKDTDQSPTTLMLKYNQNDIALGSVLETIAHADNPINNKFLRARSPLEAYKRQVVYGTTEGSWQDPFCLHPDSEIITKNGVVLIKDIKEGDFVLTGKGVFNKVEKVFVKETNDDLINIKIARDKTTELRVTGHHDIPVYRTSENKVIWIKASEITVGDYMLFPKIKFKGDTSLNVENILKESNYALYKVDEDNTLHSCIRRADGDISIRKTRGKFSIDKNLSTREFPELYKILGLYLAEGCSFVKGHFKLSTHEDEVPTHLLIERFLDHYNLHHLIQTSGKGKTYVTSCKIWSLIFRHCCPGKACDGSKKFNWDVLSKKGLIDFLNSFFEGDGHSHKKQDMWSITTSSRTLAYQIKLLTGSIGCPCSILKNPDNNYRVSCTGKHATMLLSFSDQKPRRDNRNNSREKRALSRNLKDYIAYKVTEINIEKYKGEVYDLSVEKNHTYVTTAGIVHNSTYIAPTMSAIISKNPIAATAMGAMVGSFFGSPKGAKLFGAKVGGAIGLAASLLRIGHEAVTGEAWMPPSIHRRRELEEYFDILKYVKERHLYEKKATEAKEVEGTDVRQMVHDAKIKADENHKKVEVLLEEKRALYKERKTPNVKAALKDINFQIKELSADQGIAQLGPIATEALLHRQNYRSTLYGAKSNTALMDIMSAMPKNERAILMEAIKSPDEERHQLYDLLSKPQQRVLGLFLGKRPEDLPQRPQLNQYFEHHQLPGEDSAVWSEDVDIEDLKTRALAEEMPRQIELGIFPQSVSAAEDRTKFVEVPYSKGRTSNIKDKLNHILSNSNVTSYSSAQYRHVNKNEVFVNSTVHQDRREDYKDHINQRM